MKPWTCLTVLALMTSSCNSQSAFQFDVTLTCNEIADGKYDSEFSEKSTSAVSQLYNLMLVIDQATGICDPDPLVNLIFSLRDTTSYAFFRSRNPKTWWGAVTECRNLHDAEVASFEFLRVRSVMLFNLTYVNNGMPASQDFGKNCSAITRDVKLVQVDCATKLPFFCVK